MKDFDYEEFVGNSCSVNILKDKEQHFENISWKEFVLEADKVEEFKCIDVRPES